MPLDTVFMCIEDTFRKKQELHSKQNICFQVSLSQRHLSLLNTNERALKKRKGIEDRYLTGLHTNSNLEGKMRFYSLSVEEINS